MSAAWFLDKVQDVNPASSILTLDMVSFSEPTAITSATYNSKVTVSAKPGFRIKGSQTVFYNRWSLSILGNGTVINSAVDITMSAILLKLNPVGKDILTLEDLVDVTIPKLAVGESATVRLQAKTSSFAWVGYIDVTLYRSNGTSSLEETILAGLVTVQNKLKKLEEGTVTSVEGHTGVVTLVDIGLDHVDNTADIDKPISKAVADALALKADKTDMVRKVKNISTDNLYKCQVVSYTDLGVVVPSKLNDFKLSAVAGFVLDNIILSDGGAGSIATHDVISADADTWFKATGEVGGLIQGATYFLSKQRGMITSSPDLSSVTAERLCAVGRAISVTDLMISIENPVEL